MEEYFEHHHRHSKAAKEHLAVQQDFFGNSNQIENLEKIEDSIYKVREKFGKGSIKRGTNL